MTVDKRQNYQGVFDNRLGFGGKPALLIIDFVEAYTTPGSPFYAEPVIGAVRETAALLAGARRHAIPVFHTRVLYELPGLADGGMWVKKIPALKVFAAGNALATTCAPVAPLPTETIISKKYASAFFGTPLASLLTAAGVDTLIMTGCSTSGCVRASVVDAVQCGFRAMVVRECVGDRHADPHEANLFDIDSKYGDVVSKAEVLEYFAKITEVK
jgi:maleamate amidohydrolase